MKDNDGAWRRTSADASKPLYRLVLRRTAKAPRSHIGLRPSGFVRLTSPTKGTSLPRRRFTRLVGPERGQWIRSGFAGRFAAMAATGAIGASNLGFHILGSRVLGPASYGALGALLNLIILLDIPVSALQAAVTQAVAESPGPRLDARNLVARTLLGGSAAAAVVCAFTPIIDSFLHLSDPIPALLLGLWMIPVIQTATLQGILIGSRRFGASALSLSTGTGVVRVGLGAILMLSHPTVTSAMVATVAGQVITVAMAMWPLRPLLRGPRGLAQRLTVKSSDGILALAALGGVSSFGSCDTLLARHFLSPQGAGNYAVAVNCGRLALFIPSSIALVAFPEFARGGDTARRALRLSIGAVLAIGLSTATVSSIWATPLVHVLSGDLYTSAPNAVPAIAFGGASFALVGLMTYFHVARRSHFALAALLGTGLLILLVALNHSSVSSVAVDTLIGASMVAVGTSLGSLRPTSRLMAKQAGKGLLE